MQRTIEVGGIPDDLLKRLDERAHQIGLDRSTFVLRLIERAIAPNSLAEVLAPVHDYTESEGISETEAEDFLEKELVSARRERRRRDEGGRPAQ